MIKLKICAMRWDQSTPKVLAISSTAPVTPPACAKITKSFIEFCTLFFKPGAEPNGCRAQQSVNEEQSVEHDGFGEGNGQNGLDQDLGRGAGIAPHRRRSSHSDQTHPHRCAERRQADVNATAHLCQYRH